MKKSGRLYILLPILLFSFFACSNEEKGLNVIDEVLKELCYYPGAYTVVIKNFKNKDEMNQKECMMEYLNSVDRSKRFEIGNQNVLINRKKQIVEKCLQRENAKFGNVLKNIKENAPLRKITIIRRDESNNELMDSQFTFFIDEKGNEYIEYRKNQKEYNCVNS